MRAQKFMAAILTGIFFLLSSPLLFSAEKETMLFHLKTSLNHDDAQICVAYNMIWAATEEGLSVHVLIDADAVNTYKIGWLGKDDIEGFKIPENLRNALAKQFAVPLEIIPRTYGEFLLMLKNRGVKFYINSEMLITAKIGTVEDPLKNISAKFFKPVSLKEMMKLRLDAKYYMAY